MTPSQISLTGSRESESPQLDIMSNRPDTSTMIEMGRVDFLTPCKKQAKTKTKYVLHGIVHHIGKFAFAGHYVADVLREENTWIRCDDMHVSVKSSSKFTDSDRRNAYMAFYVLR